MDFISQASGKSGGSICREDILDYIKNNGIQFLNLCYIGSDSRLKCVSFPTKDTGYIEAVLSRGERIASVFLNENIKSEESYIVPKYRDAFLNPFSKEPTLNILCSCFDKHWKLLSSAPSTVIEKAAKRFTEKTGFSLNAGGELEYYVLYPDTYDPAHKVMCGATSKHYDATSPFTVWEDMRNEAVHILSDLGIPVKYAHSESGKILGRQGFNALPLNAEQHEIEFLPAPICDAADYIVIAKWVVCNVAKKYGVSVTFSPVIEYGKPGNGMHFHLELLKGKRNIILDKQGNLSAETKRMIGGILQFAKSLCAFGNPVPTSYLRLMGRKETPYGICWGERTRKALIRIPMAWHFKGKMDTPSPLKTLLPREVQGRQTVEFRAADGTAAVHLLLAGLTVAIQTGLQDKNSLDIAEKLHTTEEEILEKKLATLPQSCWEASEELEKHRKSYEKDEIFPPELIDSIIMELKSHEDEHILRNPSQNKKKVKGLIEKHIHYSPFYFY